MPKKYKLHSGGKIIEYEDGTAGYIPWLSFSQAFRVKIADVTGFSVTNNGKVLERQLNVLGNGTLLGTASVPHGVSEQIERWFRAHPNFRSGHATGAAERSGERITIPRRTETPPSVADELRKLADLSTDGALSDEEFELAKRRLLGG